MIMINAHENVRMSCGGEILYSLDAEIGLTMGEGSTSLSRDQEGDGTLSKAEYDRHQRDKAQCIRQILSHGPSSVSAM